MARHVYDDPEFFANYAQLPRSVRGLDGAPEWPHLAAMLPSLDGARVLDLGCGFGWFSRWATAHGAARVLAIDVSSTMLERARRDTDDPRITYLQADLDEVTFEPAAYDVVFSSLAFHYVVDLERLLRAAAAALVPGGSVVASMEHPLFTAPTTPAWLDVEGRRVWALDAYGRPGARVRDWLAPGVVKQHRTMAGLLTALLEAGLSLAAIEEWVPDEAQLRDHPDWDDEFDRPMFLLLRADRAGEALTWRFPRDPVPHENLRNRPQ